MTNYQASNFSNQLIIPLNLRFSLKKLSLYLFIYPYLFTLYSKLNFFQIHLNFQLNDF